MASKKMEDVEEVEQSEQSFDSAFDEAFNGLDHFVDAADGLQKSKYFEIFDILFRKYLAELNQRDDLQKQLAGQLGNQSMFVYQRLNKLEERVTQEFEESQQNFDKKTNVFVMNNKFTEVDTREKLR